jgi:hypothetical protein
MNEYDILASLKWGIWTSTDMGNKRLNKAFCTHFGYGPVLLFFSCNHRLVKYFEKWKWRLLTVVVVVRSVVLLR